MIFTYYISENELHYRALYIAATGFFIGLIHAALPMQDFNEWAFPLKYPAEDSTWDEVYLEFGTVKIYLL